MGSKETAMVSTSNVFLNPLLFSILTKKEGKNKPIFPEGNPGPSKAIRAHFALTRYLSGLYNIWTSKDLSFPYLEFHQVKGEKMSKKVIDLLNEARSRELTAITQYMAQHYELEDADYGKLAKKLKEIAIQEMKHAEALAERILFLKGTPTTKPDSAAKKGEEIAALLATDIGLETQAIKMYNEAANVCAQEKDMISKQLFEKLLAEEEGHLNDFENIKDHLDKMGAAYLATLAG
jgi:bacterioferritin